MNYLPDSVYALCGEQTEKCSVCNNYMYSPVVNGMVHDTLAGKVFCPFGMGNSMNQTIYTDQFMNYQSQPTSFTKTTWGHAPQMDPRSLTKIGLEWRTS